MSLNPWQDDPTGENRSARSDADWLLRLLENPFTYAERVPGTAGDDTSFYPPGSSQNPIPGMGAGGTAGGGLPIPRTKPTTPWHQNALSLESVQGGTTNPLAGISGADPFAGVMGSGASALGPGLGGVIPSTSLGGLATAPTAAAASGGLGSAAPSGLGGWWGGLSGATQQGIMGLGASLLSGLFQGKSDAANRELAQTLAGAKMLGDSPLQFQEDRQQMALRRSLLDNYPVPGDPRVAAAMPKAPDWSGAKPFFTDSAMAAAEAPYWNAASKLSGGKVTGPLAPAVGYGADSSNAAGQLALRQALAGSTPTGRTAKRRT